LAAGEQQGDPREQDQQRHQTAADVPYQNTNPPPPTKNATIR
jgi:hypothetical protein